jgi:hypothetical protein
MYGRRTLMDRTKFTVRVDAQIFRAAKKYAGQHGTTITSLVEAYFRSLDKINQIPTETPILSEMTGSLGIEVSLEDYHAFLEDKYLGESRETR